MLQYLEGGHHDCTMRCRHQDIPGELHGPPHHWNNRWYGREILVGCDPQRGKPQSRQDTDSLCVFATRVKLCIKCSRCCIPRAAQTTNLDHSTEYPAYQKCTSADLLLLPMNDRNWRAVAAGIWHLQFFHTVSNNSSHIQATVSLCRHVRADSAYLCLEEWCAGNYSLLPAGPCG